MATRKQLFQPSRSLVDNLCRLMKERGKTPKQVAQYVGVTKSAVSLWLNSKGEPSPRHASKLAQLFGISRGNLFREPLPQSKPMQSEIVSSAEWNEVSAFLKELYANRRTLKYLGSVTYHVTLSAKTLRRYSTPNDDHRAASEFRDAINKQLTHRQMQYFRARREDKQIVIFSRRS